MTDSKEDGKPWDIKELTLSLGGIDDENGFIRFSVFNDEYFSIHDGDSDHDCAWAYHDIDMDAARRLRDFLNYAVPKDN